MKDNLFFDHIILIDDDSIINHVHELLVKRHIAAKNITSYLNPLNAIIAIQNLLQQENLKILVFLDLNMPEITGFEFLDKVAELENNTKVFDIIIVSSSIDSNDISRGENHPLVRTYIAKPITSNKLKELKENYLQLEVQY
ncbi:response regulator [Arenibacter certesii]|uniref:Response regulator n=1 Tax=Arenibacter certesii TaxID=228955 RepID=A0A918J5N5_9FLAO|nr:response regulator [Arenibacter certesii]GGW46790.1 response regulator [Arenibacter certesii]